MLIALADENAGNESTATEQIDTVALAKKFLIEHPEACKVDVSSHGGTKRDSLGRAQHSRILERVIWVVHENREDTSTELPLRNRQVASSTLALGSSFFVANRSMAYGF
jgi:hypothetical protein